MDYPKLIKRIRETLFLSQVDFGKDMGVSFATINKWENGQKKENPLIKTSEYIRRKNVLLIRLMVYLVFTLLTLLIVGATNIADNDPHFREIMITFLIILVSTYTLLFIPFSIYHFDKILQIKNSINNIKLIVGKITRIDTCKRNKVCSVEVITDKAEETFYFTVYNNYSDFKKIETEKILTLALNNKDSYCIFVDLGDQIQRIGI
jgi:DNA-binding XRE family transcriptional regulator